MMTAQCAMHTYPGYPVMSNQEAQELVGKPWPRRMVFSNPLFPFEMFNMVDHPNVGLHRHEGFSELVAVYGGKGMHSTAAGDFPLSSGSVFLVTGELAHGYKSTENLDLVNVVFDMDLVLRGMPELKRVPGYHALFHLEPRYRRQHWFESRLRLAPDKLQGLLVMLEELAQTVRSRRPGYEVRTRIRFMDIICYLCEEYSNNTHLATRSIILMDEVIQFIENNSSERIALKDLAERAGMAERTFLQLFREATGMSPIDYVIRTRIARASELLRGTRLSITDIALNAGFQDSNYFARQFRQLTGMTPTDYRARYTVTSVMPS